MKKRHSSSSGIRRITVGTSQFAYGFYEKSGFRLTAIEKDCRADGFDMYADIRRYVVRSATAELSL